MSTLLNDDGQPLNRSFGETRVCRRGLDELIGLCKGVMADGRLSESDAQLLLSWLNTNWSVHDVWPANILVARFEQILADGVMDQAELRDLEETIKEMIGGTPVYGYQGMMATRLPLCKPQPPIVFESREFCMTGKFVFGSRQTCEAAVQKRGGRCSSTVRGNTNYLVIGAIGSRDWKHSTHGTKIEKAIEYRDHRRTGIGIIAEEHWTAFLEGAPAQPVLRTQTPFLATAILEVGIPQIGNDTAIALAEHFDGAEALLGANERQLLQVPGIGPAKAEMIKMFLAIPANASCLRAAMKC